MKLHMTFCTIALAHIIVKELSTCVMRDATHDMPRALDTEEGVVGFGRDAAGDRLDEGANVNSLARHRHRSSV